VRLEKSKKGYKNLASWKRRSRKREDCHKGLRNDRKEERSAGE